MEAPPIHLWEVQICKSEWSRRYKYAYFLELADASLYLEWLQQRKDRVYRILSCVAPLDGARFCEATGNQILCGLGDFRKLILHQAS